jgi:hypothetical protein
MSAEIFFELRIHKISVALVDMNRRRRSISLVHIRYHGRMGLKKSMRLATHLGISILL